MLQIQSYGFQVGAGVIAIGIICVVAFLAVTIIWGIRAHRRQVSAGREEMVGKTAEVRVALEPKGVVFIQGEQWTAVSETGRIAAGEEVIVNRVDGLKLYVSQKK